MIKALLAAVAAASLTTTLPVLADQAKEKVVEAGVVRETASIKATVQSVDLDQRVVTLKGSDGKVFDLKVGPEARNLAQVKPGDIVLAQYSEAIAVEVKKGGVGIRGKETETAVSRSPLGHKPGGAVATTTTITANVTAVDAGKQVVTLEGPSGRSVNVRVKDPAVFSQIKAGEQVEMVITEAIAIAVEAPQK